MFLGDYIFDLYCKHNFWHHKLYIAHSYLYAGKILHFLESPNQHLWMEYRHQYVQPLELKININISWNFRIIFKSSMHVLYNYILTYLKWRIPCLSTKDILNGDGHRLKPYFEHSLCEMHVHSMLKSKTFPFRAPFRYNQNNKFWKKNHYTTSY